MWQERGPINLPKNGKGEGGVEGGGPKHPKTKVNAGAFVESVVTGF